MQSLDSCIAVLATISRACCALCGAASAEGLWSCAAAQKGLMPEGSDAGMADVMRWLYHDGRSSVLGGGQDAPAQDDMSLGSLRARVVPGSCLCRRRVI